MRLIYSIIIIIATIPSICFGGRGVVTVLEAPLFQEPDKRSKIVQYVRKGDVIYIHDKYLYKNPHLDDLNIESAKLEDIETEMTSLNDKEEDSLMNDEDSIYTIDDYEYKDRLDFNEDRKIDFYQTLDRIKRDSYIPAKYVKLLYNDERELSDKSQLSYDPTDYRLEEPLPKNYPLDNPNKYISDVSLRFGPNNTIYYPHSSEVIGNDSTVRSGFRWSYLKNTNLAHQNRLFFGGVFDIFMQENHLLLQNENQANELFIDFGVGPAISYTVYMGEKYAIELSGATVVNYGRAYIKVIPQVGTSEERLYSGFSLTSNLSLTISKRNVIANKLDAFLGTEAQMVFRHHKTAGNEINNQSLWNSTTDEMYYPTHANIAIIAGIRVLSL